MASEIPQHVALIMDGNRRWAKQRNLPTVDGHIEGKKRIEPVIMKCKQLGILAVSFYTLSVENLKRPKQEIDPLLDTIRAGMTPILDRLAKADMRFVPLGDLDLFPSDIKRKAFLVAERTKNNKGMTVSLALGYDGRDEIVRAIRLLRKINSGEAITEIVVSSHLDTRGIPDPDLVIRTGGRSRISGFLLWQAAYAELYFSNTLWPDFNIDELEKGLSWYQQQVRTFGK